MSRFSWSSLKTSAPRIFLRPGFWIAVTIVFSIIVTGSISWLRFRQQQAVLVTSAKLEGIRLARVNLSKGFLYITLANDPGSPFNRDEGIALLQQAILTVDQVLDELNPETGDTVENFRRSASQFLSVLTEWSQAPDTNSANAVNLRIAFRELERQADLVDRQTQVSLAQLSRKLDIEFIVALSLSAVMLTGICYIVLVTSRARQRSEAALQETHDYLDNLITYANAPIITWNPDFKITRFNRAFERLTGYTANEVDGQHLQILFPGKNYENFYTQIAHIATSENRETVEIAIRCKNGDNRIVLWSSANIYAQDHTTLIATIAQGQDITERKKAEHETIFLNDRLQVLVAAIQELTEAHNLDGAMGVVKVYARRIAGPGSAVFVFLKEGDRFFVNEELLEETWGEDERTYAMWLSNWVMSNRKPAVIEDLNNADWIPADIFRSPFIKSMAVMPMRAIDPVGVIGCYWQTNHHLTEIEHQLIQALADAAARTIENILLLESLERRVVERTTQLETSNKELESFAYSVSHDLRAPLRAIDGFSYILEQKYGHVLDEEGNRLLGVIRNGSSKMDQLITDLLALSRVSRSEINYSPIDMNALARDVYHELATPEVHQRFKIKISDLPVIYGDPILLRRVWTNLISNAIKYTLPKPDCEIEINGVQKDDYCIFSIRDNGVGFNGDYADKLFGVFQRLHKESEFEGTGVGLAIVQRIIQRHAGRVWAEGELGSGATFYFSLPKSRDGSIS